MNQPISGHGDGGEIIRKGKRKVKKVKKAPGGGEGQADALLREKMRSRAFLTKKDNSVTEYCVIIKSEINGKCKLKLSAVGEEGSEKLQITEASDQQGNRYAATGHRIQGVPLISGSELKLNIKVKSPLKLSLKLEGYALQQ